MTSIDNIPTWKFNKLIHCSEIYNCELTLPPFDGRENEAAFDIEDIKETPVLASLLVVVECLGFKYEYAKKNERIYLVVCSGDK